MTGLNKGIADEPSTTPRRFPQCLNLAPLTADRVLTRIVIPGCTEEKLVPIENAGRLPPGDDPASAATPAARRRPEGPAPDSPADGPQASGDPGAIQALVDAMRDPAGDVRAAAARGLLEAADDRVAQVFLAALEDDYEEVRYLAALGLGRVGAAYSDQIREVLTRGSAGGRAAAAVALGRIARPASVPALLDAASDAEWQVRMEAARALGVLRARRAVPALITLLGDPSPHVAARAAEALGHIGDPTALPALRAMQASDHRRTPGGKPLRKHAVAAITAIARQVAAT